MGSPERSDHRPAPKRKPQKSRKSTKSLSRKSRRSTYSMMSKSLRTQPSATKKSAKVTETEPQQRGDRVVVVHSLAEVERHAPVRQQEAPLNKTLKWCCRVIEVIFALYTVAIGVMYRKECPAEPLVPIWMIVFGSIYLLDSLLDRITKPREPRLPLALLVTCLLRFLLLVWLICGSVWIYSIFWHVSYNPTAANYCNSTLVFVAMGTVTLWNCIFGLLVLIFLVSFLFYFCLHVCRGFAPPPGHNHQ